MNSKLCFLLVSCLVLLSSDLLKSVQSANSDLVVSPEVRLVDAFPNLRFSNAVAFLTNPSSDDLLYVVQLNGVVSYFPNKYNVKSTDAKVFLDLTTRVLFEGEMGLLGLAFHPQFPKIPYVYVNFVGLVGTQKTTFISRFTATRELGDLTSELVLLQIAQPFDTQKGGPLLFDKSGYLLIGLGDGGSNGDPLGNGQNTQSLLGKMLRIDVNNQVAPNNYAIPVDNPFVASGAARPEIFALGLRNPWRCSYDSKEDNIWCADVGESSWEEVDIIKSGGNYGWKITEGPTCFGAQNCNFGSYTPPVYWYPHSDLNLPTLFNGVALIGGYVYRGRALPELEGSYIFADFITPKIGYLENHDGVWRDGVVVPNVGNLMIIGFGVDNDDEIYVLTYGDDQPIYRLKRESCGNGKVEKGEECDYGKSSYKSWNKRCCDIQTCTYFKKGTSCGGKGKCMSNGKCKL